MLEVLEPTNLTTGTVDGALLPVSPGRADTGPGPLLAGPSAGPMVADLRLPGFSGKPASGLGALGAAVSDAATAEAVASLPDETGALLS